MLITRVANANKRISCVVVASVFADAFIVRLFKNAIK